jgi:DNA-binding Xre family transcriptional regulator
VRAGPRSQQTPLSLAVVEVLNRRLEESPLRSVHGLAKVVTSVSRSQLYLLLRGHAVIDLAELFAICEALEVTPRQVIADAEVVVAPARGVAAYDEPHTIEDEQGVPEEA